MLMVELLDKNLHLSIEEVDRWRQILDGKFRSK